MKNHIFGNVFIYKEIYYNRDTHIHRYTHVRYDGKPFVFADVDFGTGTITFYSVSRPPVVHIFS
jgi:hypothetical protein